MRRAFLALALLGVAATHTAGSYAGEAHRTIEALSPDDVHAYMQGAGMGQAKAAELNGYPGPMHALELAEPLGLDAPQRAALQQLMNAHKAEARALGAEVVHGERALEHLFVTREATPEAIDAALSTLADAQARLRGSHLKTHLAAAKLMRAEQIRKYAELRGYTGAAAGHGHH